MITADSLDKPLGPEKSEFSGDRLQFLLKQLTDDVYSAEDQRQKANEDMRFINVSGGQWENFLDTNFPQDRVRLQLDMTAPYVYRFVGEWSNNRAGVEFKPDDSGGTTSDEDAELLNGMYRKDFRDGGGKEATSNAVLSVATCGYGAFKISTEYEDAEDPTTNHQNAVWRTKNNVYDYVIWDKAAELQTKKDARHCTELTPYTREGFLAQFGEDSSPSSAYVPPAGNTQNYSTHTYQRFFVATRYEVIRKKEMVWVYNNLATGEVEFYFKDDHDLIRDELSASEVHVFKHKRKTIRQTVWRTVFSGAAILEPARRIAGKWIPIIPMYGYRTYVDGTEWYKGLVRALKDAQRVFNMQMSQLLENAASHGQQVPIFTEEQMRNPSIQEMWRDRNNKPYLVVDPVYNKDGSIAQLGPLGYLNPPVLDQNSSTLMENTQNFIRQQTGGAPQDTLDPDASGKAINAVLKQLNMATQIINDNIASSFEWSGTVYQAISSEIHNTRRLVRTLGKDDSEGTAMLHKTVLDEETGKIVEANKISGKKFRAYADVGPQYESMREQTVDDIKGMIELLKETPGGEQYMPVLLSVMMENVTGVGLDPVKELNRRIMLLQGSVKPDTPEEEALVKQSQEQQNQPDPQEELAKAVAAQQEADARNLDSKSAANIADAQLKVATTEKTQAQTAEIFSDIGISRNTMLLDGRKESREREKMVFEQAVEGINPSQ